MSLPVVIWVPTRAVAPGLVGIYFSMVVIILEVVVKPDDIVFEDFLVSGITKMIYVSIIILFY